MGAMGIQGPSGEESQPPEVSQMKVADVVVAYKQTNTKFMQTQDGGLDRQIQELLRRSRHKS